MIAVVEIRKIGLAVVVECRRSSVKAMVAQALTVKSTQKNYSTCFLGVADLEEGLAGQQLFLHLVQEVQVSGFSLDLATERFIMMLGLFTASFGPGGFQTRRAGRGTAAAEQATPRSLVTQLLPLILLFGLSLLSALPNLFSTPPVPDPRFAFQGSTRYSAQRETGGLGIRYFVNQADFQRHPVIGTELAREDAKASSSSKTRGPALQKFEDSVDKVYVQDKYTQCQRGVDRKSRLKENEIGLFGIGTDWEKVKKIEEEPIESCEELKRLHVL